jgi:ParB/RepB/Spo0J family partition protein
MDAPRRRGKAASAEGSHLAPQLVTASIPIAQLTASPTNPRKNFDQAKLEELAESMKVRGVLQPILVRPRGNGKAGTYEIVAGERRFRAAQLAELPAMPAVIRDLDDVEVIECQTIENLQRDDLHPLEEAAGYQALIARAKYDVAKIAAKVGRSIKYVYDRVKLLELTPPAQKLFLEGRMTAGHAILLARLESKDQARAIAIGDDVYHRPALFSDERGLPFDDDTFDKAVKKDPYLAVKPVSVREFENWIDHNVKADRAEVDPVLFPEAAALVGEAAAAGEKVIPIMRLDTRPVAARDEKVLGERMWKRADGREGSKTCEYAEVGVIVIGPDRHEAFRMCRKRERCKVHWAAEIKAREQRQKGSQAEASGDTKAIAQARRDAARREENTRKAEAERERVDQALPAVMAAIVAAVRKAPVGPTSQLGRILREFADEWLYKGGMDRLGLDVLKAIPLGSRPEDLVRHLAFRIVAQDISDDVIDPHELVKRARAFGVDAKKILDQVAPVQTSAQPGKPVRGTCRKCGCTEERACAGGCGWADKSETRCTACFPPTLKSRAKKGGR